MTLEKLYRNTLKVKNKNSYRNIYIIYIILTEL